MHAIGILQRVAAPVFKQMHLTRASALLGAVNAHLQGRRLVLMELARAWPGAERIRNPLKRLDRLLGNEHLHQERQPLYAAMAKWLLNQPRPIIIVDWSDLQMHRKKFLLRAAVPVKGQTMTVLEAVYEPHEKQKPHIECDFLRRLRAIVPLGVRPIILTDAGFRRPWFRAVRKLGWDYVGRVCSYTHVRLREEKIKAAQLFARATARPRCFEHVGLGLEEVMRCNLVLYKKPKCNPLPVARHGLANPRRRHRKSQKRESTAWLLATSLPLDQFSGRAMVKIYAQRMQIEKSFRDLKCVRHGCAFDHSLTRSSARLSILLLIHALASFVAWLKGLTLQEPQAALTHGGILAPRARRHYSLLRLGWEALRRCDPNILCSLLYDVLDHWRQRTKQQPAYPS